MTSKIYVFPSLYSPVPYSGRYFMHCYYSVFNYCNGMYFILYILRFTHGNASVKTSFENLFSQSSSRTAFFTREKVVSSNQTTPGKANRAILSVLKLFLRWLKDSRIWRHRYLNSSLNNKTKTLEQKQNGT